TGFVPRLYVDCTSLSGVGPLAEVGAGDNVGVIEAKTRWLGREGNLAHPMRRDEGRALLAGTVHVDWDELPMPMQLFWRVGIVVDVDNNLLSLFQSHKRARKRPVIRGGRDNTVWRELDERGTDSDRVVRLRGVALRCGGSSPWGDKAKNGRSGASQTLSSADAFMRVGVYRSHGVHQNPETPAVRVTSQTRAGFRFGG